MCTWGLCRQGACWQARRGGWQRCGHAFAPCRLPANGHTLKRQTRACCAPSTMQCGQGACSCRYARVCLHAAQQVMRSSHPTSPHPCRYARVCLHTAQQVMRSLHPTSPHPCWYARVCLHTNHFTPSLLRHELAPPPFSTLRTPLLCCTLNTLPRSGIAPPAIGHWQRLLPCMPPTPQAPLSHTCW